MLKVFSILMFLFVSQFFSQIKPADATKIKDEKNIQSSETKILQKDWNFIVYIASNNDLNRFVKKNIEQMMHIGSTQNINILVQTDVYRKKEVSRYFVEKNKLVLADTQNNGLQSTSGTPESLFSCAKWGITNYPAKHHAIVLWNHGSGIEDPSIWGKLWETYPSEIFTRNSKTGLLDLNKKSLKDRGIAFNEIFETYLTNQDLKNSLAKISKELLGGKKIDILAMDACNMAMLEVGSQIKDSANIMVASEEYEPGSGWDYSFALEPFLRHSMTPEEFAKQMVLSYKEAYKYHHSAYTQSAIKLTNYNYLEDNINNVSICLLSLLNSKDKDKVLRQLKKIRTSLRLTTVFANKSYIDMYHFYSSLLSETEWLKWDVINTSQLNLLKKLLEEGLKLMKNQIIENVMGPQLPHAHGMAFYFPTRSIHRSYYKTTFAQNNKWVEFLAKYIKETLWS